MIDKFFMIRLLLTLVITYNSVANAFLLGDPLPSWNEGAAKSAILEFVSSTTDSSSKYFVPPEKRIATFDQDGTLWVEQPQVPQAVFVFNRIQELASKHPDWNKTQPFKSVLLGDNAAIAKFTKEDLEKIVMASHADMSVEEFKKLVKDWLAHAKNPHWNRPYIELVYQPMLELLALLRANGYRTYIVTGGGQAFVRVYSERVYGVPLEHVIGSALETQYKYNEQGEAVLMRAPELLINDNYAGKAEAIYLFTGSHPQAAFGNSTGDQQMLEYAQASKGMHLLMLIHHDDAEREFAYGADSKIGTFSKALMSEANQRGWHVVSMKKDWNKIFAFDK